MTVEPLGPSPAARTTGDAFHTARTFLLSALGERAAGRIRLATVPAPVGPPDVVLAALPRSHGLLWHPPEGAVHAGAGVAARLPVRGAGDLPALLEGARALWPRLETIAAPGCTAPRPRLFGGMAFAPGTEHGPEWRELGDGEFVLPRWSYRRGGASATLTFAWSADADGALAAPLVADELAAVWRALASPWPAPEPGQSEVREVDELPPARWAVLVERIRAAIAAGRFEKVVAARRTVVRLAGPVDELAALTRLARLAPTSTRFAFRRERSTFLGATPERLVARHGRQVRSEALAGSIDASEPPKRLLGSPKELAEHMLVVRALRDGLAPLCARLDCPDSPRLRSLGAIVHLATPIEGELARPTHVLELLEALHPTPAVGGVPRHDAVGWIVAAEPARRGWYAGPIGWFDAAGDGELAVAIRSGLVEGDRALVYAGAGIVAGSDAAAEYAETALKARQLLAALGVEA